MPFCTTYQSPLGEILLTSDGNSLTGLWMNTQPRPEMALIPEDSLPLFLLVGQWLDAYFQGETQAVDFPLSPAGSAFQKQVWKMLLQIPYGETTTYGALAKQISPTMAPQAVGGAVGANPISIIIPCHRVVGAKGKLTGYAGGLEKKIWLLTHEGWLKEDIK